MGDIGKEKKTIEVLPVREPSRAPEEPAHEPAPAPAEPAEQPA